VNALRRAIRLPDSLTSAGSRDSLLLTAMTEEPAPRTSPPSRLGRTLGADPIAQAQRLTEDTAQKLIRAVEDSRPVRRLRGSQIASGILGTIGFALFVVGVERAAADVPVISNAWGSIGVGVVLLGLTGVLLQRLTKGE